ncbi:T3/T7 RNA polymerase [Bradyrhizobium sp. 83012]|uniref:DNA-directed RNA polymerase n=1 Tax=Bradyrhizobium aeschynomenes TaxID=2734909 RepID=A0ABX2C8M8_9BRAD|nr:DNA-directed RNA polymerase [Bradyrhizobium aeschynomenes]NPU64622.1 T3/T7 RNA polymerase [Bradyrhizobium aeschynomenes]
MLNSLSVDCSPSKEEQLELAAKDRGAQRVRKQVETAKRKGLGADTPGGVALVKRAIEPLSKVIQQSLDDAASGKAGRRHVAMKTLSQLPAELSAYFTTREVISAAIEQAGLTATAIKIGASLEEELRLAAFDKQAPALYGTIMRQLKERGAGAGHARRVFVYAANKDNANIELPSISKTEKMHIGVRLIEMLIEATSFVEIVTVRFGQKTKSIIRPTDHVMKWLEDRNLRAELMAPAYAPMVVPPVDWTGLSGGGYISDHLRPLPLVKACSKKQHRELLERADLSRVMEALNAIQRTPWKINRRVLEVMSSLWEQGSEIALPRREDQHIPPKPPGHVVHVDREVAWANVPPEAKKAWMAAARSTHENNAASRGKRLSLSQIIRTAEDLRDEGAIYFPHQLDFRGRAYAVPVGLNPQGSDHAKALLTFAEGKPITNARAAGWLAINGANLYGFDKADFDDRIGWVEERQELILRTADEPLADLWWTEADKPWCFLAWVFEYAAFLREGYGFVSSLPVSADGSCNGLQHFSAMLRDPVGGAAVNLLPGPLPADIYQRVADRVIEKLREEQEDWKARGWIDFGIDRKLTKRPVMVLPYGGTFKSCMDYVRAAVREKIKDGKENPFGDEIGEATTMLSRHVWSSISDVVVAARVAMDWLQKCARIATKHGVPISWTTPSGFPAFQSYMDLTQRRVKTRLQGSLVFLSVLEDSDTINGSKQALAISPNFVHSLDAAAMMETILMCIDNGITQFAMIHDSYGTVAADMEKLAACLRHAFVDMYRDNHVLQQFLDGLPEQVRAECPPVPPMGSLDIAQVIESDFFFA